MSKKVQAATEYVANSKVDHRLLGFEMLLCPFVMHNSSPRMDMFSAHLPQAQLLKGGEHPKCFTGYESIVADYTFDTTERDQDAEILAVIPKYRTISGAYQINDNPTIVVVYLGLEDRKIHYFEINKYTKGSGGYGYYNNQHNHHLLNPGTYLSKDTKLVSSPIHNGEKYGLGVNANVAFMTLQGTVEDAFVISRSLAKKMQSRSIKTMTILVSPSQHPLNLYGDDSEIKFLPDIGEMVREDGILCGLRSPNESTFISDTLDQELYNPQHLHDKLYYAPAGSIILDIDFYVNKSKVPAHLYTQVEKYVEAINIYHKRIVEIYKEYKHKYELAPEFNTLVARATERLIAGGIKIRDMPFKSNTKLSDKDSLIEYLQIEVTYTHPIDVSRGFKISGRDGGKGVICDIWEDEDMPIDDFGFRADICIDPISCVDRLITGQLYEQYINRVSEFVRRKVTNNEVDHAFNYIIDYFNDINPNYAKVTRQTYVTKTERDEFVQDCINNGIFVNIPPSLDTLGTDLILKLRDKYRADITPVEYNLKLRDGTVKRIRTKKNVCIGEKYIYLLYKMPEPSASGMGYVNQFKTPIRPSTEARKGYPISQTPVRFGEDEFRVFQEGLTDPSEAMRLACLQANSPEGIDLLMEHLLTAPKPTRINRIPISTKQLVESNSVIGIVHHMLSTVGINSRDTLTKEIDPKKIEKYFGSDK